MRAFERRHAGDAVLDFLHRGQHDAAVVGHGGVVAGAARRRRWRASRPASNSGCASDAPSDQSRLGASNSAGERAALDAERSAPSADARIERGAARRRSARWPPPSRARPTATSGRRSSTSDGTPSGTAGGATRRRASGASANTGAGVPVSVAIACSNCAALALAARRPASAWCRAAPAAARRRGPTRRRGRGAQSTSSSARRCSAIERASTSSSMSSARRLK